MPCQPGFLRLLSYVQCAVEEYLLEVVPGVFLAESRLGRSECRSTFLDWILCQRESSHLFVPPASLVAARIFHRVHREEPCCGRTTGGPRAKNVLSAPPILLSNSTVCIKGNAVLPQHREKLLLVKPRNSIILSLVYTRLDLSILFTYQNDLLDLLSSTVRNSEPVEGALSEPSIHGLARFLERCRPLGRVPVFDAHLSRSMLPSPSMSPQMAVRKRRRVPGRCTAHPVHR